MLGQWSAAATHSSRHSTTSIIAINISIIMIGVQGRLSARSVLRTQIAAQACLHLRCISLAGGWQLDRTKQLQASVRRLGKALSSRSQK